jgi:catechol 2,3-dioxygenase-like lactoylglutathione lyase family enzyme
MRIRRQTVVFDAADLEAESSFWAAVLGGYVESDEETNDWHSVYDADGQKRMAVQLAPEHRSPNWPNGDPQQVHLDLWVDDISAAHAEVIELGATLLKGNDPDSDENFQVYADPAGHPFCLCWA